MDVFTMEERIAPHERPEIQALLEKYPIAGTKLSWIGFSIGPGWFPLLEEAMKIINDHGQQIHQVKEKFGSLRIYASGGEEVWRPLAEIETRSYRICEECGQPGFPRRASWIRTLCKTCAFKNPGPKFTGEPAVELFQYPAEENGEWILKDSEISLWMKKQWANESR